ncbi:hypothetical protein [Pseudoduganella namucuonensis]|uniref:Uncharacterized protein n=1 Tax=Pseudoduganella namucuonensis TaxID=1035707 RepID=A0A1I7M7M0_9BURK|nr:hypothetical protein [Pseudoduganella namucuonensis]SFV17887.1 hypothetical protein SAMN05216552_10809 [Pseudoduganella namucuonensis]
MRYPNLRYGSPAELRYYIMGHGDDIKAVARMLRRDERTVRRWVNEQQRVPWWVPEILRLKRMESAERHRQMFGHPGRHGLAVVTDEAQLELRRPRVTKPPSLTELRLDDFDTDARTG